jgi:SAM-dependent methyltransferase
MTRTTCSACGSENLDQFLDLGQSPIADAYTATPDEPAQRYPLRVAVCAKCHLVQLLDVVNGLFGTDYSFHSSASAPLVAYHEAYAREVLAQHGASARRGVLEVGCNDGDLLRHFAAAGCPTLGVDPSEPAAVAQERGLIVRRQPFSLAEAARIRDRAGRFDVVIANHVLAHVADVGDVLSGVAHLLGGDGVAFVEVQYLPDLLVNNAFDLVYHEHRQYFSLTSLESAAARHGLHVIWAKLTDRQGGSLRVTLSKTPRADDTVAQIRASEGWLSDWSTYAGMQGRAERIRTRIWDLVSQELQHGGPVAGYGAPAKATTLLNFCGLTGSVIDYVVDSTPAKQGRHIPGTGIPIVAPGTRRPPGMYLLLAHNYASSILRDNPDYHGRWLVPVPAPVIL